MLGVYGVYNNAASTTSSLSAVAGGYTNETGATSIDPGNAANSFDWESKNGAGGVAEDATGTMSATGSSQYGATIAYSALPQIVAAALTPIAGASASATALVTAPMPVTASAQATAASTGALTAPASLIATAGSTAQASAAITAQANMSATAGATAAATATIAVGQQLAATAQAATAAAAPVRAAALLTATAQAAASASSPLTAQAKLTATAQATTAASGLAAASALLVATAAATATATATVTPAQQLTPSAQAAAAATAQASAPALLTATAQAAAQASAPVGVPFVNPASLPGLMAWYDASLLALADGAAVATLPDQSGNGRDATQATGTAQPICKTNQLNGLSIVRFNGVSQYLLTAAAWTWPQAFTIIVLFKDQAAAPSGHGVFNAGYAATRLALIRQQDAVTVQGACFDTIATGYTD